jgi:hypothetical protein
MTRLLIVVLLATLSLLPAHAFAQTSPSLQDYFRQKIGLKPQQITSIRNGQPVAKNLKSRSAAEIFVFGAVFVNAAPEAYLKFADDYDRLRKLPEYLAIQQFSNPPKLTDLDGFGFDEDEVKDLKNCKPGDCDIQMPGMAMGQLRATIDWSAPNAKDNVNRFLQQQTVKRLTLYQQEGNQSLDLVYNDKEKPTNVSEQFKYLLSYNRVMPGGLRGFYNYLISYPHAAPPDSKSSFYWTNVKFGLKPTLRVLHVVTMARKSPSEPAYVIAEKQLYASHYFETALDLTFCYRSEDPKRPGFYLVKLMGSEQAGLTGFKGSIVRKVAVDRSVSSLQKSLGAIKATLEGH